MMAAQMAHACCRAAWSAGPRRLTAAALAAGILAQPLAVRATDGTDVLRPVAQLGVGYAAHWAGNSLGNRLLARNGDFPTPGLSSLSVIATSLAVSAGSSAAVYGIGEAMGGRSGSLGGCMLGGLSAVGVSALAGSLIGLDDWKSGAAVGSVMGRYLAPVSATIFYHDGDVVAALTFRF